MTSQVGFRDWLSWLAFIVGLWGRVSQVPRRPWAKVREMWLASLSAPFVSTPHVV